MRPRRVGDDLSTAVVRVDHPDADEENELNIANRKILVLGGYGLVGTAVWRGVRFSDVLNKAGLKSGVVEIVSKSADGFSDSVPLARAMQTDSLVVFGMVSLLTDGAHNFATHARAWWSSRPASLCSLRTCLALLLPGPGSHDIRVPLPERAKRRPQPVMTRLVTARTG